MPINLSRRQVLGAALAAGLARPADADEDTSRPIRIIVPYAAGGTTDQVARMLQQPFGELLKRTVIVENRPGATGTIGTDYVSRSAPDGNTLVFANPGPSAIVPAVRKLNYDPVADFKPVGTVAIMPMLLVVPASSGVTTLSAFLEDARKRGNLNYGSSGIGSFAHLTGAQFAQASGLNMVHIPFTGGAPMSTALLQGELQATFATGLDGATMVHSGQARYLGVGSVKRLPDHPDLPAIDEVIPGFKAVVWFGLLAPARTPDATIDRLNAALVKTMQQPDIRKFLSDRYAEAHAGTPAELGQLIQSDMKQWPELVRKAHIEM